MRLGYSNLLSEIFPADKLDYDDCRALQIVCQSCREPVFKVVRHRLGEAHYLSHYAANAAYVEKCEQRVAAMSAEDVRRLNFEARGQRLKRFLAVFEKAIAKRFPIHDSVGGLAAAKATKGMHHLWLVLEPSLLKPMSREEFLFIGDTFRTEIMVPDVWAGLRLEIQQQIAFDIWQTLRTQPARENMRLLLTHGWICATRRLSNAQEPSERALVPAMDKLTRAKAKRAKEIIAKLSAEGDFLPWLVMSEMVATLLWIPWLEILADEQRNLAGGGA